MELKDMILSTLKELEEVVPKEEQQQTLQPPRIREPEPETETVSFEPEPLLELNEEINMIKAYGMPQESEEESCHESQKQFYMNLRERILVLFEGFQSPQ
ncbi:CiaD-like domain-containing protein [Sulfurospirillum diekertiae]|uniref:CiaD-like domain-containing protein n=1 Tax=Sulfurospirillum diekertiae TaxID=1854492 RepID=UPI0035100BED